MSNSKNIGFVLWRGLSPFDGAPIVAIATLETANRKTGDMVQVWILPDEISPIAALHENVNGSICGDCPLQGVYDGGRMTGRACYVNVGQAPGQVHKSYRAKRYPTFDKDTDESYLIGRKIRLGAYGDPAMLPIELVEYLATVGNGWTGYSHQLLGMADRALADRYANFLMISCHNPAQHVEATRRGWRAFTVVHEKHAQQNRIPRDSVECPNYTHGVSCADCLLCQGTSKTAKSVFIIGHGKVAANLLPMQSKGFPKRDK